ncbi:hypothetical protein [Pseudomonas sp. P9(2020)]|uniref:hypothetical protein n=1 Tax=Pseudomonas sp. P9(2020) TaxID=2763316 RepID=UPI001B32FB07|nr:hypothetical protein [Pseudomonas sp. P9(2020)]MBP5947876.1 hypothetical protein [Pseudomonas sp. P9(2020)]
MSKENGFDSDYVRALIMPLEATYTDIFAWTEIEGALINLGTDKGGLELIPDFQRIHLWTKEQQTQYVECCMRGLVLPRDRLIRFNCPNWRNRPKWTNLPDGLQCLDGLQRYVAITEFVKGNLNPFGLDPEDFVGTDFSPNELTASVEIHCFSTRDQLLRQYLLLNSFSTPHSANELQQVHELSISALQEYEPHNWRYPDRDPSDDSR